MQFLIFCGKSPVKKKIQLSVSYLFQELGFFFHHISDLQTVQYFPQIFCNLSQPANARGIFFDHEFDTQLSAIEEAIVNNRMIPIDVDCDLSGETLLIKGNLLAWIYVMIAHREEQLFPLNRRDHHGRIVYPSSLACSQDWLNSPKISMAIQKIGDAIQQFLQLRKIPLLFKNPWPNGKRKAVILSHDIDILGKWLLMAAKLAVENLAKRKITTVFRITRSILKNLLLVRNPVHDMEWMLELEKRFGFVSSCHFLSGQSSLRSVLKSDITYCVESISSLLPLLQHYNTEIALHSSYFTPDHLPTLLEQIQGLEMVATTPIKGLRAHFLRTGGFSFLQAAEKGGLAWDSSEGFADISGFKTGHTGPYQPIVDDYSMKLWEFPLHWMDRTYSKYSTTSVDEIFEMFKELARQFETFGGVMTLLWHNYTVSDLGFIHYELLYEKMLTYLVDAEFYNDTAQNLVEWLNKKQMTTLEINEKECILHGIAETNIISKQSDLFQSRIIKADCNTLQLESIM